MAPVPVAVEALQGLSRSGAATHASECERSWTALHRTHYPVAVAFLRKLGVRHDHIEDVCQEVFLQMHRYLPTFRGEADLKTWMYRICISEARRHRRRERVAQLVTSVLGQADAEPELSGLEWNPESAARRVLGCLAQLPERRRTILILFDMDGLSGAQVAEIVGCSVQSVWRELHHARAAFFAAFDAPEARGEA